LGFDKFLEKDRAIILAYDQGLEHGPTDFNQKNIDPSFIMEIADKGHFNGIVFQKGLAEHYYNGRVPLIVKVNGKTNIFKGDPIARQNCSVEYAVSLGAKAVGYTIYPGSMHESLMIQEFGKIQEEARKHDLAVVVWIYPRGESVKDDTTKEVVAYAARIGHELGADAVKIKYSGDPASFSWAVKAAGKSKVLMSGGPKAPTEEIFLQHVKGVIDAGGNGVAVGRNVWQHDQPFKMAGALRALVIEGKSLEEALKIVKG
jgi:class I fructose-bisphosphate aldolase